MGSDMGYYVYSINNDNSSSYVMAYNPGWILSGFFASASSPKNLEKGAKLYENGKFCVNSRINRVLNGCPGSEGVQPMVRLYKDVFLVREYMINKWLLMRIVVP
eukprot:gnl/Chilomastix_caulleri/1740.p2 GENE.gnl/Chilomastix_caulleri/1740~~gnl/Chilomastix_caulleri/1740.p2  ORF type:complete len:104 (+),score=21.87 gnl/Chilomastix_caulleri/1740:585-896(+)